MWQIPCSKTEDLFATLNGREKFSKLDLSHAYQQLLLSPESCPLLTVNNHKGLFQWKRLQFGIYSTSAIFQREMEKCLDKIPFVKIRSDDILISGRNDVEHLENLKSVLSILKSNGLRLKLRKCVLLQPYTLCPILSLQWRNRVLILFHLQEHVINELHDCHPGIVRMKL